MKSLLPNLNIVAISKLPVEFKMSDFFGILDVTLTRFLSVEKILLFSVSKVGKDQKPKVRLLYVKLK